jgi:spermidine/putrescine transport system permease protein
LSQRTKRLKKFRFKRAYFAFPYLVVSVAFVIVPIVLLLVTAFIRDGSFSFANFGAFFTDETLPAILGRSFAIAGMTTALCLVLAYPLALILANSRFNKTAILVMLFILPMWINSLLRTYAMRAIFDISGIYNDWIRITLAKAYDFFPFMLLPLYTVLVSMDKAYTEAATDLGANAFKSFLKVTLPLSVPGIVSGFLMVFMPSLSMFAIVDIAAENPDKMLLFGHLIHDYFESSHANLNRMGAASSVILLSFILITMFLANKLTGGKKMQSGRGGVVGGAL